MDYACEVWLIFGDQSQMESQCVKSRLLSVVKKRSIEQRKKMNSNASEKRSPVLWDF